MEPLAEEVREEPVPLTVTLFFSAVEVPPIQMLPAEAVAPLSTANALSVPS